jgi:raffinose/stachyose/melibiose transport system permease protein
MRKTGARDHHFVSRSIIYALAIIWLLFALYPFVFLILNSFKRLMEFFSGNVWKLPKDFSLVNYLAIWNNNFPRFLFNSAFVVSISLSLLLFSGSSAAFGLSRLKFKFHRVFYYLFVGGMTIPVHITLIPIYVITRRLGMYDTLWALIGPYIAFNVPITVFILVSFMEGIPRSLEEAAYIDGSTHWQNYWNIVLPISRPALTAVGIYNSVILWNDFIFPLVLISAESKRPLTLALWNFQGEFGSNVPALMAALILSMIPLLVFYAVTREKLIEGLVAGAIKG